MTPSALYVARMGMLRAKHSIFYNGVLTLITVTGSTLIVPSYVTEILTR